MVAARGAPSTENGVRQTGNRWEQERGSRAYDRPIYRKAAGALLFLAGAVVLMGIITAEALYPADYSTAANTVSDLGAPDRLRAASCCSPPRPSSTRRWW